MTSSAIPIADSRTSTRLGYLLSSFSPERPNKLLDGNYSGRLSVDPGRLPIPRILQWLLEDFLGAENGGRMEKTAWRYSFTFDDHPFSLAFEKFGLRLYGSADSEADFRDLCDRILTKLDKATRIAETAVFQDVADSQIRAGNVTIHNEFHRLRNMYEYFRMIAERGVNEPERDEIREWKGFMPFMLGDEHRFHYTVAMLNAYFGWLEHTLVLCWPFCGYQPGVDDLERFIGDRWGDKFRRLFDVSNDPEANRHRERLKTVVDDFRNTFSHGGFGRRRRGILVHIPGGAPIEAALADVRNRPHFEFYPIPEQSLADIGKVFDEFDEWLTTGPALYGMRWAQGGIDVPFHQQMIDDYRAAIAVGPDSFEELLDRWAYISDQAANMDW